MDLQKIKEYTPKIVAGIAILAVLAVLYFMFSGDASAPSTAQDGTSYDEPEARTIALGLEISKTIKDLGELKRSVTKSATIFKKPAFMNLRDFSAEVPEEPVGRDNPFILTDWKIKIKALEEAALKTSGQSVSGAAILDLTAPGGKKQATSSPAL